MKSILLILLLVLRFASVSSQDRVVITGRINSFSDNTIKLIIQDLIKDQIILTKKIDRNGHFIFDFIQKYPHDNYLKYGKDLYTIFVHPGDSINIEITDNKISFSGDSKIINEEIRHFISRVRDFYTWIDIDNATQKLNPLDFKVQMSRLKRKFEDSLSVFNKKNNTSPEFRQWAHYYLKFSILDDLMRYRWLNPDGANRKLPDGYFDFIKESELIIDNDNDTEEVKFNKDYYFDINAFICSSPNRFVNEYFMLLGSTTKPFKPSDNALKKNIARFIDVIVSQSEGQTREILLTKLFYTILKYKELDSFGTYLPIFNQYIKNEVLRDIVIGESIILKNSVNNRSIPENSVLINIAKEPILSKLLDTIISRNQKKVIYIDVWSTWCSPCLTEMPYSKLLQETFKNEPVSFIYLCADSKEENWKSTIADLHLNGQHYLISTDQFNLLAERFQITGVPHYILIDKNGIIIDKNALSPSEKPITSRIRSLLK
jgi:thiol-disulfide isomerase/thioredoxin